MSERLIIFYRNPTLGKVKSRLAARVGEAQALAIYLALVRHTREVIRSLPVSKVVYYSEYIDTEDAWNNSEFEKSVQQGSDLGDRMAQAFEAQFKRDYSKVAIIGTDCPHIDHEIIADAFHRLDHHDCVLGPAMDGGYYLLGMNHAIPEIFYDIPWSTPGVLSRTTARLEALNKRIYRLKPLADVDSVNDLSAEVLKKIGLGG